MKAAILEKPTVAAAAGPSRLREVVLVRIACAPRGVTKAELGADLAPYTAHRLSTPQWRAALDDEIEALALAGLIAASASRIEASEAGATRASAYLGFKGQLPRAWAEVREVQLPAKALGLQREPAKRSKALATPEGLRSAIIERAYKLELKGVPTPSRLRTALAAVALQRAFGNRIARGLSRKIGLSAKAGRLLAGQLSRKPRDFGTDGRLIAALAAEHVDAAQTDVDALRLALLRRFICVGKTAKRKHTPAPMPVEPAKRLRVVPSVPPLAKIGRPDLPGFVAEVRRQAGMRAQGWVGNRKAYISHVWRVIRETRADWGLSEIEFKCMLAEAHRLGQLALANADLKDGSSIQDLRDSAVTYKNAVFHFVRVEG